MSGSRAFVATLLLGAALPVAGPLDGTTYAAQPVRVGVVVDFGALGGGVSTGCAKLPEGSTGTDVLAATGHRLAYRSDGLVCAIDGRPADGCGSTTSTRYWSYWHRSRGGSGWTYSQQGPSSYQPADGSTEGWAWQDGSSRTPADVAQARICPPPSPSPTAEPAATGAASPPAAPAPRRAPETGAPARPPAAEDTAAGASGAHPGPTSVPATPTAAGPRGRPAAGAAPARRAVPTTSGPAASPSGTATVLAGGGPAPPASRARPGAGSGGPGWAGYAGIGLVAAVAVAALVRSRRR